MKFISTIAILILAVSFTSAHSSEHEVPLNNVNITSSIGSMQDLDASAAKSWKQFKAENPEWNVMVNKISGTPHRAFGKGLKIEGYENISTSNIESAARSFIAKNSAMFGVDADKLILKHATFRNHRWYVSFAQMYKDVEVLNSEIELRIFENGNLFAFGSVTYDDIEIPVNPVISSAQAMHAAYSGIMGYKDESPRVQSTGRMYVLPSYNGNSTNYHLVYENQVVTNEPGETFLSYVDAHSGELVWRFQTSSAADITSRGTVKWKTPVDEAEERTFPYLDFKTSNKTYQLDSEGKFPSDFEPGTEIRANLTGKYAAVTYADGTSAQFIGVVGEDGSLDIEWTDENSTSLERNVFYWGTYIREYVKELDPDITIMDRKYSFNIYNQSQSGANAFYNPSDASISFIGVSNQSVRMADGPSVLFHEYGHLINDRLYKALGRAQGMINGSANEGSADVQSAMILDMPEVGLGIFMSNPNRVIRNTDNNNTYPEDIIGEIHHDGLILAGAFWDLREATSIEVTEKIFHFARYGTPDDVTIGGAYMEWFLETIFADDDDGDLSNGTPHFLEILESFNKHKIGTELLYSYGFAHTPGNLFEEPEVARNIVFTVDFNGIDALKPETVNVVYTTNNFESSNAIAADKIPGDGNYTASIPGLQIGAFVQYYVSVTDKFSGKEFKLSANPESFDPFLYMVGFSEAYKENFKSQGDWTINAGAQSGNWEWAIPQYAQLNLYGVYIIPLHPESDHSDDDNHCFITSNNTNWQQTVVFGSTTITSGEIDISNYSNPILLIHRWVKKVVLQQSGGNTELTIEINDGISGWKTVNRIDDTDSNWEPLFIPITAFVEPTNNFKIRITATNTSQGTLFEAAIDDIAILVEQNEINTSVEDLDSQLSIFPNPVNNALNISSTSASVNDVRIYNMLGELINTFEFTGSKVWNLVDLYSNRVAPGIYIIEVNNSEGTSRQKLVIN